MITVTVIKQTNITTEKEEKHSVQEKTVNPVDDLLSKGPRKPITFYTLANILAECCK